MKNATSLLCGIVIGASIATLGAALLLHKSQLRITLAENDSSVTVYAYLHNAAHPVSLPIVMDYQASYRADPPAGCWVDQKFLVTNPDLPTPRSPGNKVTVYNPI